MGVWNFFKRLFGGGKSQEAAAPQPAPPPDTEVEDVVATPQPAPAPAPPPQAPQPETQGSDQVTMPPADDLAPAETVRPQAESPQDPTFPGTDAPPSPVPAEPAGSPSVSPTPADISDQSSAPPDLVFGGEEPSAAAPEPAPQGMAETLKLAAGAASPLSPAGFAAAIGVLSASPEALWAVMNVETRGAGFLPSGRPKILFEGHWFHRFTGGAFSGTHPEISYATWTRDHYVGGEGEYDRLQRAMELDHEAALKSTSWGLGQVMGFNHLKAGFATVEEMVSSMYEGEDAQLKAMANFIATEGLDAALAQNDWDQFARVYNGPGYKQNRYDERLSRAHQTYVTEGVPEISVRTLQQFLERLGFNPGVVDGLWGPKTNAALNAFLATRDLPPVDTYTEEHIMMMQDAANQQTANV